MVYQIVIKHSIVSAWDANTYVIPKHLTKILKEDCSKIIFFIKHTKNFCKRQVDHFGRRRKSVSFDVNVLFTNSPVLPALNIINSKIHKQFSEEVFIRHELSGVYH